MERDIELAELGLQNQATWKVLEFAQRSREASTRLHGVAIGLLPFASAAVGMSAVLIYSAIGALFLAIVGANSFVTINGLRMLQYRLAVEEGRARVRLRDGVAVHGSELNGPTPPALRRQMDPMGSVTRAARWIAAADVGAAAPLLAAGLIGDHGSGRAELTITLIVAAAACSTLAVGAWLTWSRRHADRSEKELAADLAVIAASLPTI